LLKSPIVAIHQPPYLPWFGLLEKIALADRFVVLDTVQYNARAFLHRTLYSTGAGAKYLSLAVSSKGHQINSTPIRDITLTDRTVPRKHFETLRHRYGKRPGWPAVAPGLERILTNAPERLIDLNVALLRLTLEHFAVDTELVMASDLEGAGAKTALMLSLSTSAGAGTYLSGSGASSYMEEGPFIDAGMAVRWQAFEHPQYPQSHGGPFQPGCFALEWIIEQPDRAAAGFRDHVRAAAARIGLTT
jgi:hypothetical protein